MAEHPIESLMLTAMESIREMVDVNTIVGDPVECPDGSTVIIPVSKVSFGFAAGGGEYVATSDRSRKDFLRESEEKNNNYPFAGGSGAGVSINPVAFMVVGQGEIRLLPVNINTSLDRAIDMIPKVLQEFIPNVFGKIGKCKKDHTPPAPKCDVPPPINTTETCEP